MNFEISFRTASFIVLALLFTVVLVATIDNDHQPTLVPGDTFMVRLQRESLDLDSGDKCAVTLGEHTLTLEHAPGLFKETNDLSLVPRVKVQVIENIGNFVRVKVLTDPIGPREMEMCAAGAMVLVPKVVAARAKAENLH